MNKEKRVKIIRDIKYELAKGEHTYSQCQFCHQNSTRSGKCWECLLEELR